MGEMRRQSAAGNDAKRAVAEQRRQMSGSRHVSGSAEEGPTAGCQPTWKLEVLMEEPSIEHEERTLNGEVAFFHLRIFILERYPCKGRTGGCRELSWRLRRRQSDFRRLDTALRAAGIVLPEKAVLPKNTFFQHLLPSEEHVRQRAEELVVYFRLALDAALVAGAAEAEVEGEGSALDHIDICQALPKFLGLEDSESPVPSDSDSSSEEDPGNRPLIGRWRLPKSATERQAALVYSIDKGVFVWGQHEEALDCRIKRFDKRATLGELAATHAEYRAAGERAPSTAGSGATSPGCGTPLMAPSGPPSRQISPAESLLPSPCLSPRRSYDSEASLSWDETASYCSISTADTESLMHETERQKKMAAVWLEVNLDTEVNRRQEHAKWFGRVMQQRNGDAKETPGLTGCSTEVVRAKTVADLESTAAMYRELGPTHPNLHQILGYGVEGKTFVVVQEAAQGCIGLRGLEFTPQRCHIVLGQVLGALAQLHERQLPHGHLSPESVIISNGPLGPQARVAWTPGQRRAEGHTGATVGFRAPEAEQGMAADIWAFASIVLVWWTGFAAAPHPWTQFAKSGRPQQCIQEALSTTPPALPQALLDIHSAAALAEEPEQSFLSLLSNLLTRCFCWEAADRPSAAKLLQHKFFEQAL